MESNCQHQFNDITLVCCKERCFKFLCNNCHETHKISHLNQCNIKPINEIKSAYQEKVDETIITLQNELEKLNYYKEDIIDNSHLEEGLKIIQVSEEELIWSIKKYFEKLKKNFKEEIIYLREERINEFNTLNKRVDNVINNLKNIKWNLDDITNKSNSYKTLKKLANIDLENEVKKYDKMIVNLNSNLYDFILNRAKIDEILNTLREYLIINTSTRKSNLLGSEGYIGSPMKVEEQAQPQSNVLINSSSSVIDPPNKNKKEPYSNTDFEVNLDNYFDEKTEPKYLHYFEGGSKNVYLLPIEEGLKNQNPAFQKISLNITFNIPVRHRSIITPYGQIFICGGGESNQAIKNMYFLDLKNKKLEKKAMMNVNRKSHGITYCDGFIYAIGGITNDEKSLTKCEKYDISKNKWFNITDLCSPASSPCICSFRNKYLYKFGGLLKPGTLNSQIEKLDIEKNIWLRYEIEGPGDSSKAGLRLLWLGACVQINPNQIYVFGGCEANEKPSKSNFLFEVQEKSILSGIEFRIKKVNNTLLPIEGGFWNHQIILHDNQIICLQNILKEHKEVSEDKRNILIFKNFEWIF